MNEKHKCYKCVHLSECHDMGATHYLCSLFLNKEIDFARVVVDISGDCNQKIIRRRKHEMKEFVVIEGEMRCTFECNGIECALHTSPLFYLTCPICGGKLFELGEHNEEK